MEVILLEENEHLGEEGKIVSVKNGFARNWLIPQKKARRATAEAKKEYEARREEFEKIAAEKLAAAQAVEKKIAEFTVAISHNSGNDGRLFGSVTNDDIAKILQKEGFSVEKANITMSEPIKVTGNYIVNVRLHRNVVAKVKVAVTALSTDKA